MVINKAITVAIFLIAFFLASPEVSADEGDYMGFYWGEKCSSVADRFDGSGTGMIFESNTKFGLQLFGEPVLLRIGCVDGSLFSSGRLACGWFASNYGWNLAKGKRVCDGFIRHNNRKYGTSKARTYESGALRGGVFYTWETNTSRIELACARKNHNFESLYFRSKGMRCPF